MGHLGLRDAKGKACVGPAQLSVLGLRLEGEQEFVAPADMGQAARRRSGVAVPIIVGLITLGGRSLRFVEEEQAPHDPVVGDVQRRGGVAQGVQGAVGHVPGQVELALAEQPSDGGRSVGGVLQRGAEAHVGEGQRLQPRLLALGGGGHSAWARPEPRTDALFHLRHLDQRTRRAAVPPRCALLQPDQQRGATQQGLQHPMRHVQQATVPLLQIVDERLHLLSLPLLLLRRLLLRKLLAARRHFRHRVRDSSSSSCCCCCLRVRCEAWHGGHEVQPQVRDGVTRGGPRRLCILGLLGLLLSPLEPRGFARAIALAPGLLRPRRGPLPIAARPVGARRRNGRRRLRRRWLLRQRLLLLLRSWRRGSGAWQLELLLLQAQAQVHGPAKRGRGVPLPVQLRVEQVQQVQPAELPHLQQGVVARQQAAPLGPRRRLRLETGGGGGGGGWQVVARARVEQRGGAAVGGVAAEEAARDARGGVAVAHGEQHLRKALHGQPAVRRDGQAPLQRVPRQRPPLVALGRLPLVLLLVAALAPGIRRRRERRRERRQSEPQRKVAAVDRRRPAVQLQRRARLTRVLRDACQVLPRQELELQQRG
eukprot:scaffold1486_cov329-Prasinococcus_capsulatus_cf.AAC.20